MVCTTHLRESGSILDSTLNQKWIFFSFLSLLFKTTRVSTKYFAVNYIQSFSFEKKKWNFSSCIIGRQGKNRTRLLYARSQTKLRGFWSTVLWGSMNIRGFNQIKTFLWQTTIHFFPLQLSYSLFNKCCHTAFLTQNYCILARKSSENYVILSFKMQFFHHFYLQWSTNVGWID